MKISSLDIKNHGVKPAMRGYDKKEMDLFLEVIAGEMESLTKSYNDLRDKHRDLEQVYTALNTKEHDLSQALIIANSMQEKIRQNAEKEAEIIISQAELKADKIIQDANRRLAKLIEEIHDLKLQKIKTAHDVRAFLSTQLSLLDANTEAEHQQEREHPPLENKVAFLKAYSE